MVQVYVLMVILMAAATDMFAEPTRVGGLEVDYGKFLSRNDVVYLGPARQGWQGVPLGNGRLGAMVWQPDGIRLQLNSSLSGVYGKGEAICRLHLTTSPRFLTSLRSYKQRLSFYDATVTMDSLYENGQFKGSIYIPADIDAVVFEIEDSRPGVIHRLEVETWRPEASTKIDDSVIVFADSLKAGGEPDYRFALAVAIDGTEATPRGNSALEARGSRYTVYAAFAQALDRKTDVVSEAKARLAEVRRRGLTAIRQSHLEWWRDFWHKSLLHITSKDGVADYLENCWYLHMYAMGAGSRGKYPPKFNGGLWTHDRDVREWEHQYWHWNQQEATWPIFAANHLELHLPYQNLYFGMLPAVRKWTKEMYGLPGAQFQETIPFHGRMPHWPTVRGIHPRVPVPKEVAHTNLVLSSSAEIAMQFWWFYLYTGDGEFLRSRVYPLMKEVAAFYVGYLEKDDQGIYHMWPSNAHESFWKVKNPATDLAALRYFFPAIIEASKQLNVDAELRLVWQDRLDHLAAYPMKPKTGAIMPYELQPGEELEWRNAENPELFPIGVFPLITLGSPDYDLGLKTFYARKNVNVYGWNTDSICAARLGIADDAASSRLFPGWNPEEVKGRGLQFLLPSHVGQYQNYPCGFMDYFARDPSPEYKPWSHCYLEGSGSVATAMNEMLLQSWGGIVRVAPALPAAWHAKFALLAMGGFLISGECKDGRVEYVAIESLHGAPLRLANPFGKEAIVQSRDKVIARSAESIISFNTSAGSQYIVVPASQPEAALNRPVITGRRNEAPKRFPVKTKWRRRWLGLQAPATLGKKPAGKGKNEAVGH